MKEYKFKINGNDYNVTVGDIDENTANVTVNGSKYKVGVEGIKVTQAKTPKLVQTRVSTTEAGESIAANPIKSPAAGNNIKSPLPGVILDLNVREGDTVKAGQTLLVLEAMKMENNIDADRDGVIQSIKVRKGDSVLEGDVLVTIG